MEQKVVDSGPKKRIKLTRSEWVSAFIRIKDGNTGEVAPLDFGERQYLKSPYDTDARRILLFTSRQTEKSTSLANMLMALSGQRKNYNSLFVTPSATQTKVFSVTRIDEIIKESPAMAAFTDSKLVSNLLEKTFTNGSKIYLRYAFLSADRIRGLSVNSIFLDEIQDINFDLIPVIEEAASRFKESLYLYAGTPKTYDNTIERLWSRQSSQCEWAIPCDHHTPRVWNILGLKNLGLKGPICSSCGHLLNPEHPDAQWVSHRDNADIEGYRICRLMVPWFAKDPEKWKEILEAQRRYTTARFFNEVLALSYDGGGKPITRTELQRICSDDHPNSEESAERYIGRPLFMGIDWGGGTENSYTSITIGGYVRDDSKLQILYTTRLVGAFGEPDAQLAEIERLIVKFRIRYIGADFGGGYYQNKRMVGRFGPNRFNAYQYAGRVPFKFAWNKKLSRWLVFRSLVMGDLFSALKMAKISLPSWDTFGGSEEFPYADDILAIRGEYSETLKAIQYTRIATQADDTFHSMLFMLLASFREYPRADITQAALDMNHEDYVKAVQELHDIQEAELIASYRSGY